MVSERSVKSVEKLALTIVAASDPKKSTDNVEQALKALCNFCRQRKENGNEYGGSGDPKILLHIYDKALRAVIHFMKSSKDRKLVQLSLECLSCAIGNGHASRSLSVDIIKELNLDEAFLQNTIACPLVAKEAILLLKRCLHASHDEFLSAVKTWLPLTLRLCVHSAAKVRNCAMEFFVSVLNDLPNEHDYGELLRDEIKTTIGPEMVRLAKENYEMQTLELWTWLIKILDSALRRGTTLVNALLPSIQFALQSHSDKIRICAFNAWKALIENFAAEPDVIGQRLRLKLLLEPLLRGGSSCGETLALEKLKTWWSLVVALKTNSNLEKYFGEVVVPLLRFCTGGDYVVLTDENRLNMDGFSTPKAAEKSPQTPRTPRLYLREEYDAKSSGPKTYPCHPRVQNYLGEILFNILGCESKLLESSKLEPLGTPCCIGPSVYDRYAPVLIQCLRIWSEASEAGDKGAIAMYCWKAIFNQTLSWKNAVPLERYNTFIRLLLTQLRQFIDETSLQPSVLAQILTAFGEVAQRLLRDVHIAEMVELDCPLLYLWYSFLNKQNREADGGVTSVAEMIIDQIFADVSQHVRALDLIEKFTEDTIQFANNLSCGAKLTVWTCVCEKFTAALRKWDDVDQGNDLEHKFTAGTKVLYYPITAISAYAKMDDVKFLSKCWRKLYTEVVRCTQLASTTDQHTFAIEFCDYLSSNIEFENLTNSVIAVFAEIIQCITDGFDCGGRHETPHVSPIKKLLSPSPSTTADSGSLNSLFKLLHSSMSALLEKMKRDKLCRDCPFFTAALSVELNALNGICVKIPRFNALMLFVKKFSTLLSDMLTESEIQGFALETTVNIYVAVFDRLSKLNDGAWEARYLTNVEPLLTAALTVKHPWIKNEAMKFWRNTFHNTNIARSPALNRLIAKESKTMGMENYRRPSLRAAANESQDFPVSLAGISPRPTGGLLNKRSNATTPEKPFFVHYSPSKESIIGQNSVKRSSKKKLILDDNKAEEFVVIAPVEKRTMVLTEHQKESFRQNKELPFLSVASVEIDPIPPMFVTDSQLLEEDIEKHEHSAKKPSENTAANSSLLSLDSSDSEIQFIGEQKSPKPAVYGSEIQFLGEEMSPHPACGKPKSKRSNIEIEVFRGDDEDEDVVPSSLSPSAFLQEPADILKTVDVHGAHTKSDPISNQSICSFTKLKSPSENRKRKLEEDDEHGVRETPAENGDFTSAATDAEPDIDKAKIISPASTPSAGILKKRRHNDDVTGSGFPPTPPSASVRRVHFMQEDLLTTASDDEAEQVRLSPRKRNGTPIRISRQILNTPPSTFSSRFLNRTVRMIQQIQPNGIAQNDVVGAVEETKSRMKPSDNAAQLQSSDSNQLIYPALTECPEPLEPILPNLAGATGSRSLMSLLKSRNISTIGQFASLTESQVAKLPIRQPKIEVARTLLQQFDNKNRGEDLVGIEKEDSTTKVMDMEEMHMHKESNIDPSDATERSRDDDMAVDSPAQNDDSATAVEPLTSDASCQTDQSHISDIVAQLREILRSDSVDTLSRSELLHIGDQLSSYVNAIFSKLK